MKIGTCAYYGDENTIANGQTIRSVSVTNGLIKHFGSNSVIKLNYHNWRKHPLRILYELLSLEKRCDVLILFPDENAIRVIIPLTVCLKSLLGTKIYYNVIGGWLPEFLYKNSYYANFLRRLDGLFVQTYSLKSELAKFDIKDIYVFPNFKDIEICRKEDLVYDMSKPLKICFVSRVTEKKGIKELVTVIKDINKYKVKYCLDIYGPISEDFVDEFSKMQKYFPEYIKYKGIIDAWEVSEVLKKYFLQVFPTKYNTEGFPGSILDSFCAGVPVLASRWDSYADVIDEGINGITFEFLNFDDMKMKLERIYDNPKSIMRMKSACIDKAKEFRADEVIKIMINAIKKGKKEPF